MKSQTVKSGVHVRRPSTVGNLNRVGQAFVKKIHRRSLNHSPRLFSLAILLRHSQLSERPGHSRNRLGVYRIWEYKNCTIEGRQKPERTARTSSAINRARDSLPHYDTALFCCLLDRLSLGLSACYLSGILRHQWWRGNRWRWICVNYGTLWWRHQRRRP